MDQSTQIAFRIRRILAGVGFALSLAIFSAALATSQTPTQAQTPTPTQANFFETKIRPLLAANCYPCHGPGDQLAGLRVDSLASVLKGGSSGPAVVPGDPDKSLLIQAVRQTGSLKMPKGGKLQAAEVADLEDWVKMGAPWPEGVTTSKQYSFLWSLQPVKKPPLPKVKNSAWIGQPLDAFVLAKLEAKNIKPAPPADRHTLLRRVTYDLTGLPPTPESMDAFLADKSPGAYERVVDRLLNSPQYGERWARHWLDVARYADTKGYVFAEDRNYYNAYTYRDWVIRAFNEDLPYDRFILDQLAADRLPEVRDSDDKRTLAALGFLTVGRRFLNSQPDIIDDRIDVTMRGFQAFTVECARCHDHKFDPIPTQDYYSLYAVFASSSDAETPISEKSIRDPWIQYNQRLEDVETSIRDLALAQTKLLRQREADPSQSRNLNPEIKQILQSLNENQPPDGENLNKLLKAFEPAAQDKLGNLQKEHLSLERNAPPKPEIAMAMMDNPHPSDGVVFKHGNPNNPGDAAPRRFLLAPSKPGVEREHWTADSGRLELAKAIASRDNPLTARVFVNRVWQDHFGTGIVRTASDFGHQGDLPTNPELLDYLASTFMENGWSIKKLQKMIVTSSTYIESSSVSPSAFNADPDNKLFGRMNRRRLDLEEMRDTILSDSGTLDLSKIGGKSVELWSKPFTSRRAVYGFIERQNLPGIFRTFDFASPDRTSSKRFLTTVPQQALFFMNSEFCIDAAKDLAGRSEVQAAKDDAARIRSLYRLLFQRDPDADEVAVGLSYLKPGAFATVASPNQVWSYGLGEFDPTLGRVSSFRPLAHYSDVGYHAGEKFPDPNLGYAVLNNIGGHPGRDAQHAVIRRWTAPGSMTVQVSGTLIHGQAQGDGVRARIVSSRSGLLGEWRAHNDNADTALSSIPVQKGDTIDFIVDPMANDAYDSFAWAPSIRTLDGKQSWDAGASFGPPPPAPLTRLQLYCQALMMTNEFMFVD